MLDSSTPPLLNLDMRLGEARGRTGIDCWNPRELYTEMATFERRRLYVTLII